MNDISFKLKKENPDYDDEDIQSIVEQKYLEQIYSLQIKRQNEQKMETETGKLIFQFNEHKGMIKSVAISPGNQYVASGGQDSTVKIYRLRDKEPVIFDLNQKNGGHKSMVVTVCFSEDNRFFASAGTDMIIKLWNGQTFELISNLRGHANSVNQIQFFNLEEKTQLISCSGLKTGLEDFSIKIWNVEAESGTNFFKEIENGHQKPITDVIFTRNNLMLVSLCEGGIIKVFNPINGYLFYTFEAYKYHKSEQKLLCISVSADSRLLFVGGEDGQISVYDLFNGVYKRNTFSKNIQDQVIEDLEKQIQKKRDKFNYQHSKQEKIDNNYNEQENDFIDKYKSKYLAINKIVCTQRESDRLQNYFITCQGEQIVLWEQINQNREIKNKKINSGSIISLLIDNENKNVLTGTEKGIIDIWFIDTFEHIYQINNIYPVNDMVLSLEKRFLYTCSTDGSIRKIDIRKNTVINKYQEHKSTINGSINALSLSQNGDYFAYGGQDCDIYLHTFIDNLKISGVQERVITSKQVDFSCYNAQFEDIENLNNFNLQRLQIASQKKDIVNKPQLLIVPVTQDTGCTTKVCSIF
ncbi:WD40-repeat-containing domain [Pseudocohnilembus persalinus]|uniref:WD40-repeat-containing domain n=1 Tax=Pseudocohnilembus persalinus TaxID=266149 RepID=A0A0V0QGI8_PSEPJ|nr:WD40-repeat-containing domain [Pseudocohnilembus persalinus]|eukprot:KRX01395.1 WD40-repeat-containing domain [Pseudocohnilembus persalinus]